MQKGSRIEVQWIDAQDMPGTWIDEAEAEAWATKDKNVTSLGYLVRKTDKYLTIAGDFDGEDGDYGRVTKIPIAWIKEITMLSGVSA